MRKFFAILCIICLSSCASAQLHPTLIVAEDDIQDLKSAQGKYPLWDATLDQLTAEMDAAISEGFDVPTPKDPAGGYTHEKHKANGILLKNLGLQYQLTGDAKYADYAKAIFLLYAEKYPEWGPHPVDKSYARGRIFWQQLNEAVFLCDAIQGYDCILSSLSEEERQKIENQFLLPFADFISIETPFVFNKIHNHGVWAAVAVGMTGMALDNEELIARAFYGLNEEGEAMQATVDGYGDSPYGFFAQTKALFSPDGYYTEGPYYQRYAMTPFLLFAQSINQYYPEMKIFDFQDHIFTKAVKTLINLTDSEGQFFPINDHMKGMGLNAPSMVWAMDFLYARTKDPQILGIAEKQGLRTISMGGMEIARALAKGEKQTLALTSKIIRDGQDGTSGGLAVMRNGELTSISKFATHGMDHGHFDRLNLIHYHNDVEVLSDYGAARYVNVKAKDGGRYLPENDSYAKQTIAHNTLVVDATSQFGGNYKEANKYHSDLLFADFEGDNIQIIATADDKAYPQVRMKRVFAQITHPDYELPLALDVFVVDADAKHMYDLPYHFLGEIIDAQFELNTALNRLEPLGESSGYEHLWRIADGHSSGTNAGFTWMLNHQFYSLTTLVDENTDLIFTRIGANDPHFNLRAEPAFIVRQNQAEDHIFASVIECHGDNNPNTEIVSNQEKMTKSLSLHREGEVLLLRIVTNKDSIIELLVNLNEEAKAYSFELDGEKYELNGKYKLNNK